uniref:Secreted protein n=1 Tax=Anguilla anguilla TaxID=7936 RepID=A0A0E9PUQ4_ANGAN
MAAAIFVFIWRLMGNFSVDHEGTGPTIPPWQKPVVPTSHYCTQQNKLRFRPAHQRHEPKHH